MLVVDKRKVTVILLGTILLVVVGLLTLNYKSSTPLETYRNVIKSTTKLKSSEFNNFIKKEPADAYVYFGRETCPDCIDFLNTKNVQSFFKSHDVYYINTENTDSDSVLSAIRDKYKIEFVPSILHVTKKEIQKINENSLAENN